MQRIIVREEISKLLINKNRILEIGPSTNALKESSHLLDYIDNSHLYPSKEFITHDLNSHNKLPFNDNFFDLTFCSHVLEHMLNPENLLDEINRISKSGIIIVPTKFSDNLLSIDATLHNNIYLNDKYGHKFFFDYGEDNRIIISERLRVFRRISLNDKKTQKIFNVMPNLYEIRFYFEDNIKYHRMLNNNPSIQKIRIGYSKVFFIVKWLLLLNDSLLDIYSIIKASFRKTKYNLKK